MRYLDIYILLMLCAMWKKTKTDNKQKQMKTCQTHISYLQHTTLVEKNIFWKNKWSIYKSSYLVCRLLWSRILEIFISIIGLSDYVICYTSSSLYSLLSTHLHLEVDHPGGPPLGLLLPLDGVELCGRGRPAARPVSLSAWTLILWIFHPLLNPSYSCW